MDIKKGAKKKIKSLIDVLQNHGFQSGDISEKPFNFEITVKKNDVSHKVLVYFGKKGIKSILQGSKEADSYRELLNLISDEPRLNFNDSVQINEPAEYIGSDESGKGDIFGPLVVCAAYTDTFSREKMEEIGVIDSKKLSDGQIAVLADRIRDILKDNFDIVSISPEKYNDLYGRFNNLNKILEWAHSRAIENLLEKTETKTVIIDKFTEKSLSLINKIGDNKIELILTSKAERFTGVAAASILARDFFNKWFQRKEIRDLKLVKGASESAERAAQKLIEIHGEDILKKTAKLHFRTFRKINKLHP